MKITPDLVLKHPDATLVTYECSKTKHASETLEKTPEKYLKTIVKHTQHPDKTLTTYI